MVGSDGIDDWLHPVPTCPSTNEHAIAVAAGLADGDCVWTEHQTAGRGQHDRVWLSPPGVLTASFLLRMPPGPPGPLSLAAGVAIARTVESLVPDAEVAVKWPNDCLCRGRKLAGVLCRARQRPSGVEAVVGIGLNLDPRWRDDERERLVLAELPAPPIALADLTRPPPAPHAILARLRTELLAIRDDLLADPAHRDFPAVFAARDWLHGRQVRLRRGDERLCGRACGIDATGRLLLHTAHGREAVGEGRILDWGPRSGADRHV